MRAGALNLPGRGARANEPALTEMEAVLDLAQAELNTISDKPFAFFGHSAGAVMAFALASRLIRTRQPTARLRLIEHGGVTSAAMIYDRQPIIDHFREVEPGLLLGLMDLRGMPPFFFTLRRE